MSTYKDYANPSQTWSHSADITVDNTGAGGAGAQDITVAIPSDWDEFWNHVDAQGDDVRVCDADGQTLLTFDLDGFNATTRAGSIEIDGAVLPAAKMCRLTLYWGNSSAAAATTSFVPASAKTGYIELGGRVGPTVQTSPEIPGQARPRGKIAKTPSEILFLTFDFDEELQRRRTAFHGSMRHEEIDYVEIQVLNTNGSANDSGMYTEASIRFVKPGRVIVEVKAGTTATEYLVEVTAITTFRADTTRSRKLVRRQQLRVRNVTVT
jgi:hypothetical protein